MSQENVELVRAHHRGVEQSRGAAGQLFDTLRSSATAASSGRDRRPTAAASEVRTVRRGLREKHRTDCDVELAGGRVDARRPIVVDVSLAVRGRGTSAAALTVEQPIAWVLELARTAARPVAHLCATASEALEAVGLSE